MRFINHGLLELINQRLHIFQNAVGKSVLIGYKPIVATKARLRL